MKRPIVRTLPAALLAALLFPAAAEAQPAPAERAQPVTDLARYFYPPDQPANAQGRSGLTSVRLTVGPNGRVTGCSVQRSSGSSVLDSSTCRILVARARFRPARDSAGVPMEDRFDATISWPPMGFGIATNSRPSAPVMVTPAHPIPTIIDARDPRDRPVRRATVRGSLQGLISRDDYPAAALRAGEEGMTSFALIVGANGRVTNCRIIRSSGSSALDSATCRLIASRARFTPAVDRNGQPMEDFHESHISWTLPRR